MTNWKTFATYMLYKGTNMFSILKDFISKDLKTHVST